MKHIHTFEEFLNEGTLNYTQAMELGALSDAVKNHIKTNYSELYYGGGPNNILGKYGKDIPGTSWKKLEKLAKDKGDKDLGIAISNYKDLANKYKVKTFENLNEGATMTPEQMHLYVLMEYILDVYDEDDYDSLIIKIGKKLKKEDWIYQEITGNEIAGIKEILKTYYTKEKIITDKFLKGPAKKWQDLITAMKWLNT